jgi:hypothetical protein
MDLQRDIDAEAQWLIAPVGLQSGVWIREVLLNGFVRGSDTHRHEIDTITFYCD